MDAATAPLAPNVRVLLVTPGVFDVAQAAAAPMDRIPEAFPAEVVQACTGVAPVLADPREAPGAAAQKLLAEPAVTAVVLVAPEGLAPPPTEPGVMPADLNRCCEPDGADHLIALLLTAQHPPRARVVAATGARGGLGVSTFLLHLARACHARGKRVAIVDADPAGSLGLLMGDGVLPGLRWADLPANEVAFRPERLVTALPEWLGMPVLTGDGRGGASGHEQLRPAVDALRAEHDLVMIDLPRGGLPPADATILLMSGLDLRSAVAAEALAARLKALGQERAEQAGLGGPQTLAPGPAPGTPTKVYTVVRKTGEDVTPDELALMTRTEIAAIIPHERAVAQRIARGDDPTRGRGALRSQARAVADRLLDLAHNPPEDAQW
ncbi:cobalamin biosynthesis protein CobQ [Actinomyces sp. 432]|uniref:cellulose synthase operon protein YhjQ/BcsQ n=1 Tax=Actinomyces sp. 432 TaxID=2057798 RepID=UPI001373F853|nr:cellulose synthase operon protein YhjQ/BcsQ [Actinomyces sp. 432]QHO90321.1 cobalamin biosynthesis protein CobQ [Actinomyces sp. 432]